MSDVVSRLLAAIQEREDVAEAARQQALAGDWFWVVDAGSGDGRVESRKGAAVADGGLFEVGPHIALNDPASVLRLCQAHREIVEEHSTREVGSLDHGTFGQPFTVCRTCCVNERRVVAPCPTILKLAAGYGIQEDPR